MVPIRLFTIIGPLLILACETTMPQPTPTSTVQALYDAVGSGDWTAAAALADSRSLETWHKDERASIANLFVPHGSEELHGADTAAVDAILRQNANASLRLPGLAPATLGTIGSLSAKDYLARLWEFQIAHGRPTPKAPPFEIIAEMQQNDGSVRVQYRGYLGIGGGMPESLELKREAGGWRYVVIPELTMPSFGLLVSILGVVR